MDNSYLIKMKNLAIGLIANYKVPGSNEGIDFEYASEEMLQGITLSLEATGSRVLHIDANRKVFKKLKSLCDELDLGFNISEGPPSVKDRKSYVPRMLDMLSIPYTGSGKNANRVAGNKALTRQKINGKVNHPGWQLFNRTDQELESLRYPLFVKPVGGGSSIGIEQDSVVYNEGDLRKAAEMLFSISDGQLIVEEYLEGKEYICGMIGDMILPPLEWDLDEIPGKPLVKDRQIKDMCGTYSKTVNSELILNSLAKQAIHAHQSVGASDYSRSDFRSRYNRSVDPLFLEINTMPNLGRGKSMARAASLAGISYEDAVNSVVYSAIVRLSNHSFYRDIFSNRNIEGFSDAYNSAIESAENRDMIEVGGKVYMLLKPKQNIIPIGRPDKMRMVV